MKKFVSSRLFSFILGAIIFGGIGVASAYTLLASDKSFTPKDTSWSVDNVEDALNDIHRIMNTTAFKKYVIMLIVITQKMHQINIV